MNLLALYNLYLLIIFAVGTALRYRLYLQVIGLILSLPQRWPKLSELVMQQRWLLINRHTLLPTALTLLFTLLHSFVLYVLLPDARLTLVDLAGHLGFAVLLLVLAILMLALDAFALYMNRGELNAGEVKKQLDQAEFWLSSRWADVVTLLTFKKVRPRQIFQEKLYSALQAISQTLNQAMWLWAAQLLARFLVALVLWITWFSPLPERSGWFQQPDSSLFRERLLRCSLAKRSANSNFPKVLLIRACGFSYPDGKSTRSFFHPGRTHRWPQDN